MQTLEDVGRPGRPLIGPKAQTHIPQHQDDWIRSEAFLRDLPYADMMRNVITAGISHLQSGA